MKSAGGRGVLTKSVSLDVGYNIVCDVDVSRIGINNETNTQKRKEK